MIDLFSVKLNNEYDFIQDSVPSGSGTWLVSDNLTGYSKGESYQVTDGSPVQIEKAEDYKINRAIYKTIETACDWLNFYFTGHYNKINLSNCSNWQSITSNEFYIFGDITFSGGKVTTNNEFQDNDLVQIDGVRNKTVSYITVSGNTITFDNTNIVDTTENAVISLMAMPFAIEEAISQMIHFDVFLRGCASDMQSENVGSYSYSKEQIRVGGLGYPASIVSQLRPYKKVRFMQ